MRKFMPVVFFMTATTLSAHSETGYTYYNCADQQTGVPLGGCATLSVDETLSEVMIADNGSKWKDFKEDTDFFSIGSPLMPLAIPREGYEQKSEWAFRDIEFRKIQKNFSVSIMGLRVIVDIISASQSGKVFMTFWYSESAGVQAVGFPSSGQVGTVYYCSTLRCLFAK